MLTLRPPAEDASAEAVDLGAMFSVLWQGRALIFGAVLLSVLIGALYVFALATPRYRATAAVVLETRQEQVVEFDSVIGGLKTDLPAINTEVEILKSRRLMGRVVDELRLLEDPEFNAALRPPGLMRRARALLGLAAEALPPDPAVQRDKAITALRNRTAIVNVPLSLVFTITVETEAAAKSARLADRIAQDYITDQINVKFEATEQAVGWLTDRVSDLQAELERAEARVKVFRASTDLAGPESVDALDRQLKALRGRITEQAALFDSAQRRMAELGGAVSPEQKIAIANDPMLQRVWLQQADAAGAAKLPSIAPFDLRFQQLQLRAETEARRAEAQLRALRESEARMAAQIDSQTEQLIQTQQLTREAEASRLLYEYFLGRLKETSVQQGLQRADSRLLSPAVRPDRAASPQKARVLGMSGVLGLMLGVALVALNQLRARGFRTAAELERASGATVLGSLPDMPGETRNEKLARLASDPATPAAEAVRNLRTSLLMARIDTPPQVLLVTSAMPGEGKTVLAMALAQTLAGMGKRVLIVEGDLRRCTFSDVLGQRRSQGLLSVLSGETELPAAVVRDGETGLEILPGDEINAEAADVFASDRFARMIDGLRANYDHIVIDSPPVLVVPDARVLSRHSDAILFAVKWNETTRAQVTEGLRLLATVNGKLAGTVLTKVDQDEIQTYGYGYTMPGARHAFGPV